MRRAKKNTTMKRNSAVSVSPPPQAYGPVYVITKKNSLVKKQVPESTHRISWRCGVNSQSACFNPPGRLMFLPVASPLHVHTDTHTHTPGQRGDCVSLSSCIEAIIYYYFQ